MTASANPGSDERLQRTVLLVLLDVHPAPLTRDELQRCLDTAPADLADALADLVAVGLIHVVDRDFVLASQAAVAADRLLSL